jgi:L-seryl-tRNA(Ser) seleniumtransferase
VTDARRALPSVGVLLERPGLRALAEHVPRALVTEALRALISAARHGASLPADDDAWVRAVEKHVAARTLPSLRSAINATGVVLHTNLGRAPLAPAALEAVAEVARAASTLEYDIEKGARGSRHVHCAALLAELTGAEDALVVNNCAAALVLALQTFAAGRETIVSRGELVEIGGSFRVPDIMTTSGTALVEVGTTNRTHADDYRRALSPRTGAIVKVHRSNFALEGFVAEAGVRDLAPIAAEAGVPLLHDFGSGLMLDLSPWGLAGELTAREAVAEGATLVMMSGDKLLGGPQAGIIVGKREAVDRLRAHPLARALRVDKLTLAALEATLALYRDPERARLHIPALKMLTASADSLRARADTVVDGVRAAFRSRQRSDDPGLHVEPCEATVGGGAFPTARIPSWAVTIGGDANAVEARLRTGHIPVIARIEAGRVRLDLRSIDAADDESLVSLLVSALG